VIHHHLAADTKPIVRYQTEPKEKPAVNDLVRSYESYLVGNQAPNAS